MGILNDINELVNSKVISQETADKIEAFYASKGQNAQQRLFLVFGILGAILVGLGLILIIAHNWDNLSKSVKTVLAFVPLLLGQGFCLYTLWKREDNITWRESSSAFLFFAVGACISLISQIYNIQGNLGAFLLTWMLLCLPLVYLMKSSIVSLLYLAGITFFACETGYWGQDKPSHLWFWLLLLGIIPHYLHLIKNSERSNFLIFHNWMIPLSLIITLGSLAEESGQLMFIAYFSLFGIFILIGLTKLITSRTVFGNGYEILGSLGTIILLLILSFFDNWKSIFEKPLALSETLASQEFYVSLLLSIAMLFLLFKYLKSQSSKRYKILPFIAPLFILVFALSQFPILAVILINMLLLSIGIQNVYLGSKMEHLGVLNFGLLIIIALIACRFFDLDISFVLRGIIFIAVGIGFFYVNYQMLKKRREDAV